MDNYYVEIVSFENDKVVKSMGPMSGQKAIKVDRGARRSLWTAWLLTRLL